RFGGAVPLIEEMSKDHDGSVSERDTALEIALDRAEKFNASINRALNEDGDRMSSGLLQTIAQNPTTYAILGRYIWGMVERRNREDSYDDDFGDDEEGRLSSGMDFDKKGASGLREMRHAERNPLRYDSPEDKAARDSYEETVANFIKNNG
ncbi:MAG: hypothetical protein JZU67_04475, partial [Burkholderiaceae bacterium]|nr:hypothetical protein [Burkholderiaceae bacterium]